MGRWTVLSCLLIFYGHTFSQPLKDDGDTARQTRQLDFGECCPCPGSDQREPHDIAAQDSRSPDEGSLLRARYMDDCPCRPRLSDSEGAASVFFPTAMRADGAGVRPAEKKDSLKPLLHPEVDLASSVLQTLREVTDEEYQQALARDAARNIAKAAVETVYEDADPEASDRNLITLIVHPKQSDREVDVIPMESHIQESRCIHSPLEVTRNNFDKMQDGTKPTNLLHDIFGLPRTNKPKKTNVGTFHRNLLDMDNNVGASNIQEHLVHSDGDHVTNKGIKTPSTHEPLLKKDSLFKSVTPNMRTNVKNNYSVNTIPDLKFRSIQNTLKELTPKTNLLEGMRFKPIVPKLKASKNNMDNLNSIQEEEKDEMSYFKTTSLLDNILDKNRSASLKNLLKLKDVELIPLKDIVKKAPKIAKTTNPELVFPPIFNNDEEDETKEIMVSLPEIRSADVNPRNVNVPFVNDDCKTDFKVTEDISTSSTEVDTFPSPSETQLTVNSESVHIGNSQSDELTNKIDDCVEVPIVESNQCYSMEKSIDDDIQEASTEEFDPEKEQNQDSHITSNEERAGHNDDADSITDSNNSINVFYQKDKSQESSDDSLSNKNMELEQEQQASDNCKIFDHNIEEEFKSPVNKTLLNFKENRIKNFEDLRNSKFSSKYSKFCQEPTIHNSEINDSPLIIDGNLKNCFQSEELSLITTLKPEIINGVSDITNESLDKISIQDLQKLSDSMLQEEKDREYKVLKCDDLPEEVNEKTGGLPLKTDNIELNDLDTAKSSNSQIDVKVDPQTAILDFSGQNKNNVDNVCQSELILPYHQQSKATDANGEASNVVINTVPQSQVDSPALFTKVIQPKLHNINFLKTSLPDLHDVLKLAPAPVLDEIRKSVPTMFNSKNERDDEEYSLLGADSMMDRSNTQSPTMATDASTTNFQIKPLRLMDINDDLDILQLKPQLGKTSIPKTGLHYKAKLPFHADINKPIKMQSTSKAKDNKLRPSLVTGRTNARLSDRDRKISQGVIGTPLKSIFNSNDAKTKIKTKNYKILDTPLRSNIRNSVTSSPRLNGLSENIHSHTKNTWKSMQQSLQSKFKEATQSPTVLPSLNLLETMNRNHEDVNDKLRALHIDLYDRIDSMRNNLFDKSRLVNSESHNKKENVKTFPNQGTLLSSQYLKPLTERRENEKSLAPRRSNQQKFAEMNSFQTISNPKHFKMPAAASVPVPRTVEVPELKTTLEKSPGLALQRGPNTNSNVGRIRALQENSTPRKQVSAHLPIKPSLRKQNNPFKDTKIKVFFSTTSRPTLVPRLQSRVSTQSRLKTTNREGNEGRFSSRVTYEDHNGSPSEVHNLLYSGMGNERVQSQKTELSSKPELQSRKTELETYNESGVLESWPNVSESAFLSKIKEDVKSRLSKVTTLKQTNDHSNFGKSSLMGTKDAPNSNTDIMTQSASKNFDFIEEQPLQENVSYKCKMICTKE